MKKTIGILFGGKSTEHEISIISARNVFTNLDKEKYEPVLLYIDKNGKWFYIHEEIFLSDPITVDDANGLLIDLSGDQPEFITHSNKHKFRLNAVFPILHGPNGEDGSMQGLLKVAGIPFVGPDVLGSAVSMDKEVAKKLLEHARIPIAAYVTLKKHEYNSINPDNIIGKLGLPVVVKPANAGSSVGLTKANSPEELMKSIEIAFNFDNKIIVEEHITGREIECAVLGNENPMASVPGEIITEFYDYEAKYLSETKAKLSAPAELEDDMIKLVRETAIRAYRALECEGMSRVDFFLTPTALLLNELNTIPGFTNISMYPKLFELSGISNKELITRLIELAIERHERNNKLKTRYEK